MDKQAIAKPYRQLRQAMSVEVRLPWDMAIQERVYEIAESYQHIALYAAFNHEVDTYALMETWFWDPKKHLYLPRVEEDALVFYEIHSFTDIQPGHFGILEPRAGLNKVEADVLELMLIPLSAFHESGHRIGYGRGYYDRYLRNFKGMKLGLAYEFQKTGLEFYDERDIACDYILSEAKIYEGKDY